MFKQYATFTNLINLIENLKIYFSLEENIFFNDYYNLETADTEGLDLWGKILNFKRGITPTFTDEKFFGFYDGVSHRLIKPTNFNNGTFYRQKNNPIINLSDELYRQALQLIYSNQFSNNSITNMSIILNSYYQKLDKTKKIRIFENVSEVMTILIQFNFKLTLGEINILSLPQIILKPDGVSLSFEDNVNF